MDPYGFPPALVLCDLPVRFVARPTLAPSFPHKLTRLFPPLSPPFQPGAKTNLRVMGGWIPRSLALTFYSAPGSTRILSLSLLKKAAFSATFFSRRWLDRYPKEVCSLFLGNEKRTPFQALFSPDEMPTSLPFNLPCNFPRLL